MARNNYFLSWDLGRDRKRLPRASNRTLIRLGIFLGILLALILIILLVVLGHNARADDVAAGEGSNGNGGRFEPVAKATHGVYSFAMPDFIPGSGFPGMPDLSRFTWNFIAGCGPVYRLLSFAIFVIAVISAYKYGLRGGSDRIDRFIDREYSTRG